MGRKNNNLPDRYSKILELADNVDSKLYDHINRMLSSPAMEEKAINYIVNETSFHRTTRDNSSFLYYEVDDNCLDLELAEGINEEFLLRKLIMKPLNRATLSELNAENIEDRTIRLIHYIASNMPYEPEFRINVVKENGGYKLTNIQTNGVLCYEYQVDLSCVDNKYVLTSTKFISNCEQYSNLIVMNEMDLVDYQSSMGSQVKPITPDDLRDSLLDSDVADEEYGDMLDD